MISFPNRFEAHPAKNPMRPLKPNFFRLGRLEIFENISSLLWLLLFDVGYFEVSLFPGSHLLSILFPTRIYTPVRQPILITFTFLYDFVDFNIVLFFPFEHL